MAPGSKLCKIFFLFYFYHIFLFLCFSVSASLGPCKLQREDNVIPLTGTTGTLFSPLYPQTYPPSMTCTWMITVPKGKFVKLKISSFFLERFWFPEIILWARIFFVFKWSSPLGSIFIFQMRNIWEVLGSMQFSRLSASVSCLIVKFTYKPVTGWVWARAEVNRWAAY